MLQENWLGQVLLALGRYRLHLQLNLGWGWRWGWVPLSFWPAFLPMGLKILLLGMLMLNRCLLHLLQHLRYASSLLGQLPRQIELLSLEACQRCPRLLQFDVCC